MTIAELTNFNQIAGVLGILKNGGVELPWLDIDNEIRLNCAEGTQESWAKSNLRRYRRMAIDAGLLGIGELTSWRDCVPLVD